MLIMKYFTPSAIAFVLLATSLQAYSAVIPSQPQVPADGPPPARAPQVPKSQPDGKPLQEGALGHHVSRELGATYYARRDEHSGAKESQLGRRDVDGYFGSEYLGRRNLYLKSRTLGKRTYTSVEPKQSWSQKLKAKLGRKKKDGTNTSPSCSSGSTEPCQLSSSSNTPGSGDYHLPQLDLGPTFEFNPTEKALGGKAAAEKKVAAEKALAEAPPAKEAKFQNRKGVKPEPKLTVFPPSQRDGYHNGRRIPSIPQSPRAASNTPGRRISR